MLGTLVGLQSAPGKTFWRFVQSSRIELRKVVWPNRQETLQVTLVVFVMLDRAGAVLLGAGFAARIHHALAGGTAEVDDVVALVRRACVFEFRAPGGRVR